MKKKNHKYKLICIDIDGTLINDNKQITQQTKLEINRVVSKYNVKLILVSSRTPQSIDLIAQELKIYEPIICYNGALIIGEISGSNQREVFLSVCLSISVSEKIISYLLKSGLHIGIFNGSDWFVNKLDYWGRREIRANKVTPQVDNLKKILRAWGKVSSGPQKIMIRGPIKKLDVIFDFLIKNFHKVASVHRMKGTVIEITPMGVSKATGVKFLCNKLKIKSNNVMAFGDSYNDLEMLKFSGLGIAMGNSPDIIKEVAKEVTASNSKNGIAISLKKHFS